MVAVSSPLVMLFTTPGGRDLLSKLLTSLRFYEDLRAILERERKMLRKINHFFLFHFVNIEFAIFNKYEEHFIEVIKALRD